MDSFPEPWEAEDSYLIHTHTGFRLRREVCARALSSGKGKVRYWAGTSGLRGRIRMLPLGPVNANRWSFCGEIYPGPVTGARENQP